MSKYKKNDSGQDFPDDSYGWFGVVGLVIVAGACALFVWWLSR